MTLKQHLPLYGVGPFYGITIAVVTILGIVLSRMEFLQFANVKTATIPFLIVGIAVLVYGFTLWFRAAFRIDHYVKDNELCTDGIYGIVRNPCYSGVFLVCTGALIMLHNICLLILPFLYWLFMTILLKHSEEKWLLQLYGQPYADYCKRVNRCIPWFSK